MNKLRYQYNVVLSNELIIDEKALERGTHRQLLENEGAMEIGKENIQG